MTTGARGRGFFAGAIGGLALALLLVGVVSYLPQPNAARQALFSPAKDSGQGASGPSNSTHQAASTTTAGAAYGPANQTSTTSPGPQVGGSPMVVQAPATSSSTAAANPPAINTATVRATTTVTVAGG